MGIMKALTMPSHLAATTKIMISMTATELRRMTTTTTSTRRWKKLWSRTTTITVTIVAVLMITLAIRFIVIDLTGMATIFMAQGMGMPTLAIMAILIMVMSHTAIITRTNTVEKTTAICTNMEAKHRVKPVVKPKSETILKPIYKAEPLKKQVVLEEKVVKPHAYGVHKVVDHKYEPMHVHKPLYEKKYVHDYKPSYEGKYGYGHGYDHGYDHGYEHHRYELKPGYDHGYDYAYKHKPVVKYGYYY